MRRAIRRAVKPYGLPADATLSLAFVGDDAMKALNRKHRRRSRTTDVLSFGQRLRRGTKGERAVAALVRDVDGTLDVGDIVVSGAQAERQARRAGHSLEREVAFLAAHGALHLLGFEDDTRAGYAEMVRLGKAAISAT